MARAASARSVGKTRAVGSKRGGWKWWQGMLGGMLLMLSPGAALVVAIVSAPALFVVIADTTPNRTLTRTVILFSVAGAIEPLRTFLFAGHDVGAAIVVLTRPAAVLLAWLCAGCGWLLDELFCLAAAYVTNLRHASRRASLETMLAQVRREWALTDESRSAV